MNYNIAYNSLLDYIVDRREKYKTKYIYEKMKDQDLFNAYFKNLIDQKETRKVLIYTD